MLRALVNGMDETEECSRCGQHFNLRENYGTACTFHADADGRQGVFTNKAVTDNVTGKIDIKKIWSCCGKDFRNAPGCRARPHMCKEVMISVRAEANPLTRVENIEMNVLKTLEISIFPGVEYDLQLQLTKSMTDMLHNYFNVKNLDDYGTSMRDQLEVDPKSVPASTTGWLLLARQIKQVFYPNLHHCAK